MGISTTVAPEVFKILPFTVRPFSFWSKSGMFVAMKSMTFVLSASSAVRVLLSLTDDLAQSALRCRFSAMLWIFDS